MAWIHLEPEVAVFEAQRGYRVTKVVFESGFQEKKGIFYYYISTSRRE